MRVLFLGDTHANRTFLNHIYRIAVDNSVEAIVQAGDFGFWPRLPAGLRFLESASRLSQTHEIPLYFVDGNHEDHESLDHESADGPTEVTPGVFWLPRGAVTPFGQSNILSLGGAVSVDSHLRTPGRDWFHSEVSSIPQRARAYDATGVDIVVAHDAPTGTFLELTYPVRESIEIQCIEHRDFCREILDKHRPRLWVAGHYHQRRTQRIDDTRVEVLAHDGWVTDRTYLIEEL